jgi:hypothetical protein
VNKPDISNPERGKTLVMILILLNTVLVAAISALQVDATIRANQANRDSQYYAAQVDGGIIQTGHQADYEMNTYSIFLNTTQEAQVAGQNALLREAAGNQQGFDILTLESRIYQAQAEQAKTLSVLMTDPAYAPASDQELPDISAFSSDLNSSSLDLAQKQNDANNAYHRWNNKSDSYVAVLTVLAIAFFLLGVAQIAQPGMRSLFSSFAIGVISIGILWALTLVIF